MCGIAGIITAGPLNRDVIRRMIDPIVHRGPDDKGVWIDEEAGVGLGHRRLSIVDLSAAGHQPMESRDGRWVLNFNGEIYNHGEVRRALEDAGLGVNWRGHSDTETLVEAIAQWGLRRAIERCVGMFAIALWDRHRRELSLASDRFGEKPMYYGWVAKDFLFASELKAIRSHPKFDNPIDRRALARFASRTYVPAPHSIYERIFKLEPGHILAVNVAAARAPRVDAPREGAAEGGLSCERYWSYREVVRDGLAHAIEDEGEALDALEEVLGRAVRDQSVADVPVGAFLSGGIDSSSIVALYQKYSSQPVRTFTIGFDEAGFDEAEHAQRVAAHFGTEHHEHYVSAREALDVIPLLPAIYDEPFADSSQVPTYLVSRFARQHVKVALTGDGGDELFAGYNRHVLGPELWRRIQNVPAAARAMAGGIFGRLPARVWSNAASLLPGSPGPYRGGKVQKALRVAGAARGIDDIYRSFVDEWSFERSPVIGAASNGAALELDPGSGAPDAVRMMYCDAVSYLPGDILCKVDRASMATSLETRVPFLDHRVAELAARIPLGMKVRDRSGKYLLKQLLHRHAPQTLFERPKAGFAAPTGEWIKGPLREWAEELLDAKQLRDEGFFDARQVRRRWRDHLAGRRDGSAALWGVLMFEAWRRETSRAE